LPRVLRGDWLNDGRNKCGRQNDVVKEAHVILRPATGCEAGRPGRGALAQGGCVALRLSVDASELRAAPICRRCADAKREESKISRAVRRDASLASEAACDACNNHHAVGRPELRRHRPESPPSKLRRNRRSDRPRPKRSGWRRSSLAGQRTATGKGWRAAPIPVAHRSFAILRPLVPLAVRCA
jgi:hypothetical protein